MERGSEPWPYNSRTCDFNHYTVWEAASKHTLVKERAHEGMAYISTDKTLL